MTETILITGASGFLGKRIVRFLQRSSDAYVITTSRKQESFPNHLVRDLSDITSEITHQVDTVVHFAGLSAHSIATEEEFYQANTINTMNLAKAAIISGVKRFVFISTTDVYGMNAHSNIEITEESAVHPKTSYAKSKLAAENELKALCKNSSMNLIILRLPLIYHIDIKNKFGEYIKMVQNQQPLPLDKINNRKSLLALRNFESALNAVLSQPEIQNEVMVIADDLPISTTEMMKNIAIASVVPIKLFYVPKILMRASLTLTGKKEYFDDLWGNSNVSSKYAQQRLNWKPFDNFIVNLSK